MDEARAVPASTSLPGTVLRGLCYRTVSLAEMPRVLDAPKKADSDTLSMSRLGCRLLWATAFLGLTSLIVILPRSPLPWFDEILMESTALSIANGNPPIPSVLGAFHGTKSFGLFFGPVALGIGAAEVKTFGISQVAWRTMGWIGVLTLTLLASWIAKRLGDGMSAAATVALVAFSQGMGRAVSGRLDSIVVAFELASLGCAIAGLQSSKSHVFRLYSLLSGLFCGLAISSTPRAFPFAAGLFLAFAVGIVRNRRNPEGVRKLFFQAFIAGAAAFSLVLLWTLSEKTDPIQWLKFIASTSHSDAGNVSPLLGGEWHLLDGPMMERINGVFFLLVLLSLVVAAIRLAPHANRAEGIVGFNGLSFALIAAASNYGLTLLLISRAWDYDIFLVPLLVPPAVALSRRFLQNEGWRSYRSATVLGTWILWATACLFVRCGKIAVWAASYTQSDTSIVTHFVADHVPSGSFVFGPSDLFFYAVENAGSHYLYPHTWIASGLSHDAVGPSWNQLLATNNVYLIWPAGSTLTSEITPDCLQLIAQYQPEPESSSWPWRAITGAAGAGYPRTLLFRVIRSPAAHKTE